MLRAFNLLIVPVLVVVAVYLGWGYSSHYQGVVVWIVAAAVEVLLDDLGHISGRIGVS